MGREDFSIELRPEWASPLEITAPTEVPEGKVSNGIYYAASDRHFRVETGEEYGLFARQILNPAGVQDGSEISILFDPAYETIALHSVDVLRDGQWTPRLSKDIVHVLQREEDMDNYIVHGRLTLIIRLPDIQSGDLIRYEFTRKGQNPIMDGHFSMSFGTAASEPRGVIRVRLEEPPGRPLQLRFHGEGKEPVPTRTGNLVEWHIPDPPVVEFEKSIPNHLSVIPWVEVSGMKSWSEVVDWALPLYVDDSELPPDLIERIESWKDLPAAERASAALQLVQDEVRYLGDERGIFAYKPRPASEVFARRAGDCKEKVQLLRKILAHTGIDSHPVLVNSSWRQAIQHWLPSPYAFDHVILEIHAGENPVFVDPTRTGQRGPLSRVFIPEYKLGLRLKPGETGLCSVMPDPSAHGRLLVEESMEIPSPGSDNPATLMIKTTATGRHAEYLRNTLSRNSLDELARDYLEYYSKKHPTIENLAPLKFHDDTESNRLIVEESYSIPGYWKLRDNTLYQGIIPAQELENRLAFPDLVTRKFPFAISHVENFEITTHVSLPFDWPPPKIDSEISNPWFDFSYAVTGRGNQMTARGSYASKTSEVAPPDVPQYQTEVQKAYEASGFELTYDTRKATAKMSWRIPVAMVGVGFLTVLTSLVMAVMVLTARPPAGWPAPEDMRLDGLGGWLVLVGIGVVLAPLSMLGQMVTLYLPYFTGAIESPIANPENEKHLVWVVVLLISLAGNCFLTVMRVVTVPLFFLKKWMFPKVFVLVATFNMLILLFDGCVSQWITPESGVTAFSGFLSTLVPFAIWIPYMLISKRVKATFRR